MATQLVSWACGNLSKRGGRKHVNPHMLRHWFATDMIKRGINPEIARRQLRHKNIETTMKIYVQITNTELEQSVPTRPRARTPISSDAKVIHLGLHTAS